MAYTLGNKCAKNCCKRTFPVQLIVEDVVTCFLEHSVIGLDYHCQNMTFLASNCTQRDVIISDIKN